MLDQNTPIPFSDDALAHIASTPVIRVGYPSNSLQQVPLVIHLSNYESNLLTNQDLAPSNFEGQYSMLESWYFCTTNSKRSK